MIPPPDGALRRDGPGVVIVGGGGHAKVVRDALESNGFPIAGFTDQRGEAVANLPGLTHLGTDDTLLAAFPPPRCRIAIGVGGLRSNVLRRGLFERFDASGYDMVTVVHIRACVAPSVRLGRGVQIMAGAVVQSDGLVGDGALINTRAGIDHDCFIGDHAHIGPGATLCGGVIIGPGVLVGAGAVLLPGVRVGGEAIIGAGAVVLEEVPPGKVVIGVPARMRPAMGEAQTRGQGGEPS
ncbi:hypothetical protein GAY31_09340 [Azospirillum brasilense]|nr:hypothetical protein [Azospirillum brasilense]